MQLGIYRPPYDIDFSAKDSNFACWPSQWQHSATYSKWLGTVSFTHKWCGASVQIYK